MSDIVSPIAAALEGITRGVQANEERSMKKELFAEQKEAKRAQVQLFQQQQAASTMQETLNAAKLEELNFKLAGMKADETKNIVSESVYANTPNVLFERIMKDETAQGRLQQLGIPDLAGLTRFNPDDAEGVRFAERAQANPNDYWVMISKDGTKTAMHREDALPAFGAYSNYQKLQKSAADIEKQNTEKDDKTIGEFSYLVNRRDKLLEKQRTDTLTDIEAATLEDTQARIDYLNYGKQLGRGIADTEAAHKKTRLFAEGLGVKEYELSTLNVDDLAPEKKEEFRRIVEIREAGLREKMPTKVKEKLAEYEGLGFDAEVVKNAISSDNVGFLDALMDDVNKYFGLEFITDPKAYGGIGAYNDFRNTFLKIMSGAAVTASEAGRFNSAFGTLYQSEPSFAAKFNNQLQKTKRTLQQIKESYDPIAFNYRFGNVLRNFDISIDPNVAAEQPAADAKVMEEAVSLRKKNIMTAEQIKQRKPNWTDQQIQAYLKQQGQ